MFLVLLSFTVMAVSVLDSSESEFSEGSYNHTIFNSSLGAVQLSSSEEGTYTSQIFKTGSDVSFNNLSWVEQRINCEEGMAYIDKSGGYCIDKYEASMPNANSTHMGNSTEISNRNSPGNMEAQSVKGVVPWVDISQINARTACENAGKHLCTDEEWLGASNIKGEYYNLPANLADAPYYCVTDTSTNCVDYTYDNGDACTTGYYDDNGDDTPSAENNCSSAEGVYDMTGNVWEWTNETVDYTKPCNEGSNGWCYWNGTMWSEENDNTGTEVFGNDGVYYSSGTQTGKAVRRGGDWLHGAKCGPFSASLSRAPSSADYGIGFRCCSS